MSYDIFCYRSKLGRPNEEEADTVIEAGNNRQYRNENDSATKFAIVKALTTYNSKLEVFDFDEGEIANLTEQMPEAAREKFDHIEINTPSEDLTVQMTVFDDHVFITVPHWYKGNDAQKLFRDIRSYIRIIRETAGYFVLDPQIGLAFDPLENELGGLKNYLSIGECKEEVVEREETKQIIKSWWQFW